MKLQIKYFGLLSEITQRIEEEYLFKGETVEQLLNALEEKYPKLKNKTFRVAQNQTIVNNNAIISENQIMLFPPFSGG